MNSRLIKGLLFSAAALLVLLIAMAVMKRPSGGKTPFAQALHAQKITLQAGPAHILLQKDGPLWYVSASTAPERYRAQMDKIKALQTGLKSVSVEDVISERAEGAQDFETDATSGTKVTMWGEKQVQAGSGIFGKQAPGSAHIYFRYPDRPEVYLARGISRGDVGETRLNAWRDPAILNVSEDHVLTLLVEAPGVKVALARSSNTWSLNGRSIDPVSVWNTLGVLAHLRAEDFVDLSQRPDLAPEKLQFAALHLQMQDGTTHQVRLGRLDAATKRYPVAVNTDAGSAWVGETTVKPFLRKPAEYKSQ